MKGIDKGDVPFNLERILSGKDPVRDCWFIGNPCAHGHGIDGRNVRYHGRRSCVACNLVATGKRGKAPARNECMGEGCTKMLQPPKKLCQECKTKARNGTAVDMCWYKEPDWECFMAQEVLHQWAQSHAMRVGL